MNYDKRKFKCNTYKGWMRLHIILIAFFVMVIYAAVIFNPEHSSNFLHNASAFNTREQKHANRNVEYSRLKPVHFRCAENIKTNKSCYIMPMMPIKAVTASISLFKRLHT